MQCPIKMQGGRDVGARFAQRVNIPKDQAHTEDPPGRQARRGNVSRAPNCQVVTVVEICLPGRSGSTNSAFNNTERVPKIRRRTGIVGTFPEADRHSILPRPNGLQRDGKLETPCLRGYSPLSSPTKQRRPAEARREKR